MKLQNSLKSRIAKAIFGVIFAFLGLFSPLLSPAPVFADEQPAPAATTQTNANEPAQDSTTVEGSVSCDSQVGQSSWIVCGAMDIVARATDTLYGEIEKILVIKPISMEDNSPIYKIWQYCRSITNIVFIIFLLVVIYSQITGVGISNYGIKKALPKLIVAAVTVNLSFLICTLAIDVSNIAGQSLRGMFNSVQEATLDLSAMDSEVSFGSLLGVITGGGLLTIGGVVISFLNGSIWMLLAAAIAALASVFIGFVTIALRQAVVSLLVMIAPLAFVCNILPNTEKYFKKWKDTLFQMLIFYPTFSLLFGASALAGQAIIASATSAFAVILGLGVQIYPLFFSWKLMKMSGSVLGGISEKLSSLTSKPLATNKAWAERRRDQTQARNLQYGRNPYSRLQRYLDNRKELHLKTTDNLRALRKNDAGLYVQRKISGGYDGTKATEAKTGNLKANKYTRIAKDLSNSNMAIATATMDTEHTLENYEGYYIKEGKVVTRKVKEDKLRAAAGANNYLELHRAQFTKANDEEADLNFMVGEYLKANFAYGKGEEGMNKFRHYIASSAGGLGEAGNGRVLGHVLAKAAAVESAQRRDMNIIASKFPPDKRSFRNMLVGYYVNDDGFATDKDGRELGEKVRGEFLMNNPEKLVMWDQRDADGHLYYDWYDTNGNYVTRIYKEDKPAIKELFSNFDTPINDPINNLYGILAGVKENRSNELTGHIGLDAYRTTIARAILGAQFKEKNACFGPMVANMISCGYIQNYAQENLAYLDSFNKATKPGAFNTQDADAVNSLVFMMDPANWEQAFPTEMIRGFRNVNGKPICGIRYDAEGNAIKVPAEEATRDELMEQVKQKFILPAAQKMTLYMSRQTPNTMDSQKGSVSESWKKLKGIFDTKYGIEGMKDPYEQAGDTREMARDIQQKLYVMENGSKHYFRGKNQMGKAQNRSSDNHNLAVEDMYITSGNDPDTFATEFVSYCDEHSDKLGAVREQFVNFMQTTGFGATADELHDYVIQLLDSYYNE